MYLPIPYNNSKLSTKTLLKKAIPYLGVSPFVQIITV